MSESIKAMHSKVHIANKNYMPSKGHKIVFLWNHLHLFKISGVIT